MNTSEKIQELRAKRDARVLALHARGKSLREIGRKVGLTQEGVRKVVKKAQRQDHPAV